MRTAQAILLPAIFGLTREQTADAVGLSASRVGGIQAEARNPNPQTKGSHGGRRRQTMTLEEEKQVLQPWVEKSASAGMVIVFAATQSAGKRMGRDQGKELS